MCFSCWKCSLLPESEAAVTQRRDFTCSYLRSKDSKSCPQHVQTKPQLRLGIVYAQVVVAWKEMLLCFMGFMVCLHVMDLLAPLPSYLWEATRDWFWFPKIRWENQIRKSCRQELGLKNTWLVLCHSVLVGSTLLLSYCSLPQAQCQSHCSRGLQWFCLALCCSRNSMSIWVCSG